MNVALLVLTDGRADCIARTIASAEEHLPASSGWWPIGRRIIHDDSADPAYRAWLALEFPDWEIVAPERRLGFGGAIANAWAHLCATAEGDTCEFVFHLEDDFTMNGPVDLTGMAAVLRATPNLAQMALRRQPVNEIERAAGGIVECWPDEYREHKRGNLAWLEHRLYFTTNPSLYRRSLCWRGWPTVHASEVAFSQALFADPDARCGYWGARDSGEAVHHIGDARVGTGY